LYRLLECRMAFYRCSADPKSSPEHDSLLPPVHTKIFRLVRVWNLYNNRQRRSHLPHPDNAPLHWPAGICTERDTATADSVVPTFPSSSHNRAGMEFLIGGRNNLAQKGIRVYCVQELFLLAKISLFCMSNHYYKCYEHDNDCVHLSSHCKILMELFIK